MFRWIGSLLVKRLLQTRSKLHLTAVQQTIELFLGPVAMEAVPASARETPVSTSVQTRRT